MLDRLITALLNATGLVRQVIESSRARPGEWNWRRGVLAEATLLLADDLGLDLLPGG